jgi:small subunit ribosomal protein S4
MHGQNRRRKATDYALALAEKQKMRFYYGLMEKQFRGVYEKAIRRRGVTGEIMLQILETRLDSVVHNLGFGYTRSQARQMVSHGHVMVNSKRARTPSIALHEGDVVEIKTVEKSRHLADKNLEYSTSRIVPEWLTLDKAAYKGTVTRLPTREDIEPIANEQTIVEFYSR